MRWPPMPSWGCACRSSGADDCSRDPVGEKPRSRPQSRRSGGCWRDLRELGYYLSIVGELSRYGLWGLRYDHYDPDADSQQQSGLARVPVSLAFSTLTATAAVTYPGLCRLSISTSTTKTASDVGRAACPPRWVAMRCSCAPKDRSDALPSRWPPAGRCFSSRSRR